MVSVSEFNSRGVEMVEDYCRRNDKRFSPQTIREIFADPVALKSFKEATFRPDYRLPKPETVMDWIPAHYQNFNPDQIEDWATFNTALPYIPLADRPKIRRRLHMNDICREPYKRSIKGWANYTGLSEATISNARKQGMPDAPKPRFKETREARLQIQTNPRLYSAKEWARKLKVSSSFVYSVLASTKKPASNYEDARARIMSDPYKYTAAQWASILNVSVGFVHKLRQSDPSQNPPIGRPRNDDARLQILADPQKHSVQEWAGILNVSKAFVYKTLRELT